MSDFATLADVNMLFRTLTGDEAARVEALLPLVSDALRYEAAKVGKDIDEMIENTSGYASTVKLVTVDIVSRVLRQSTTSELMAQESQGALGYTWSGTYAIPGGGIAQSIMRNDLKRLGLKRQQIGVLEVYESPGEASNVEI